MAITYGSCPRGCGRSVAYSSVEPNVPLDVGPEEYGSRLTPHACAETPASSIDSEAATAARLQEELDDIIGAAREAKPRPAPEGNGREGVRLTLLPTGEGGPRHSIDVIKKPDTPYAQLQLAAQLILEALGEDAARDGLVGTPARFARMWLEFKRQGAAEVEARTFEHEGVNQMVIVQGLRVWSYCEHHLLPFYCDVDIGVLATKGRVLGLSKFGRLAQRCASRLGMQERLVEDIASAVSAAADTPDVIVTAKGEHLCMTMRGARMPHAMTSSAARGAFLEKQPAREEFLLLTRR